MELFILHIHILMFEDAFFAYDICTKIHEEMYIQYIPHTACVCLQQH